MSSNRSDNRGPMRHKQTGKQTHRMDMGRGADDKQMDTNPPFLPKWHGGGIHSGIRALCWHRRVVLVAPRPGVAQQLLHQLAGDGGVRHLPALLLRRQRRSPRASPATQQGDGLRNESGTVYLMCGNL